MIANPLQIFGCEQQVGYLRCVFRIFDDIGDEVDEQILVELVDNFIAYRHCAGQIHVALRIGVHRGPDHLNDDFTHAA